MSQEQLSLKKLKTARRNAISVGDAGPVKVEPWCPESQLPLVIEPTLSGLDALAWAKHNREFIETSLLKHGGILFRHFNIRTADFAQFMQIIASELLEYNERSSPRTQVS